MTYRANAFECDRCHDEVLEPAATFEFYSPRTSGSMDLCRSCANFCIQLLRLPPNVADDLGYIDHLFAHEPPDRYEELRIA